MNDRTINNINTNLNTNINSNINNNYNINNTNVINTTSEVPIKKGNLFNYFIKLKIKN